MSESEGIVKSVDGIFKVCQECLAYTVVEKIHAVPFLCKYLWKISVQTYSEQLKTIAGMYFLRRTCETCKVS